MAVSRSPEAKPGVDAFKEWVANMTRLALKLKPHDKRALLTGMRGIIRVAGEEKAQQQGGQG